MVLASLRVTTRARTQRSGTRYRNRSQHPAVRSTQRLHQILLPPEAIGRKCDITEPRN
jgi:hypothetical protein